MKKVSPNGNMYRFVSHTWNPVKGACPYGCHYCYVNKWGNDPIPLRLDERELRANLGEENFIFVCSGCDLFHPAVPDFWIAQVICQARNYQKNKYLFHTKNPGRILELAHNGYTWPGGSIICVTAESDGWYRHMGVAPAPLIRLEELAKIGDKRMITIEPVMKMVHPSNFANAILKCHPVQVNIGADSCGNDLPEPSRADLEELIELLAPNTKVHLKKNLRRLLPEHRLYNADV